MSEPAEGTAEHYDVVIVGAGHGGVHLATTLGKSEFSGSIALLSNEDSLPYERPPLSKELLSGAGEEDFYFRTDEYWKSSAVSLQTAAEVVAIDPDERIVSMADGRRVAYQHLVWAAGGRARQLAVPGSDLQGVHSVRTLADVRKLRSKLDAARNVVIIGGGYIGLEFAAGLRHAGIAVTVVEVQERLLARVTGHTVSRFIGETHDRNGVDIRLSTGVDRIEGVDGHAAGVKLSDGETLPSDLVIVGVGLDLNVGPMVHAGADCANGIVVDEFCRTSLDGVFAIGDCANHINAFVKAERFRLESVQNAVDQAAVVASVLMGSPEPYSTVPWFWSNQYDVRLKTAGVLLGHDREVVRGEPSSGKFTVGYFDGDRLLALDCVNTVADFAHGRTLVARRARLDADAFADPTTSLKVLGTAQADLAATEHVA